MIVDNGWLRLTVNDSIGRELWVRMDAIVAVVAAYNNGAFLIFGGREWYVREPAEAIRLAIRTYGKERP